MARSKTGPYVRLFRREQPVAERTVRADKLRAACLAGREVHLRHAIIAGPLDLSGRRLAGRLRCEDCRFRAHVDWKQARFASRVDLVRCGFAHGLDCTETHFHSSFD